MLDPLAPTGTPSLSGHARRLLRHTLTVRVVTQARAACVLGVGYDVAGRLLRRLLGRERPLLERVSVPPLSGFRRPFVYRLSRAGIDALVAEGPWDRETVQGGALAVDAALAELDGDPQARRRAHRTADFVSRLLPAARAADVVVSAFAWRVDVSADTPGYGYLRSLTTPNVQSRLPPVDPVPPDLVAPDLSVSYTCEGSDEAQHAHLCLVEHDPEDKCAFWRGVDSVLRTLAGVLQARVSGCFGGITGPPSRQLGSVYIWSDTSKTDLWLRAALAPVVGNVYGLRFTDGDLLPLSWPDASEKAALGQALQTTVESFTNPIWTRDDPSGTGASSFFEAALPDHNETGPIATKAESTSCALDLPEAMEHT